MSDTYMVTLPNGEQRGPFSREVLVEVARSGGLPLTSIVRQGQHEITVEQLLLTARTTDGATRRRLTAEERARLGGTHAATPSALAASKTPKNE